MRIKCLVSIKLKEIGPIIPSDISPDLQAHHRRVTTYLPEADVFEQKLLFFEIDRNTQKTDIWSNDWMGDLPYCMNYAYALKGINKQLAPESHLNQAIKELLDGDGIFQIDSPPDQIDPPPLIPPRLLEKPKKSGSVV